MMPFENLLYGVLANIEHFGVDGGLHVHSVLGGAVYLKYELSASFFLASNTGNSAKVFVVLLFKSVYLLNLNAFLVGGTADNAERAHSYVAENVLALYFLLNDDAAVFLAELYYRELQQTLVLRV